MHGALGLTPEAKQTNVLVKVVSKGERRTIDSKFGGSRQLAEAVVGDQLSTFEAGRLFAETEGLIPAPETCHAIQGVVELAREAKRAGEARVIAFNFSGHGLLDMEGYAEFLDGRMPNA